MPDAGPYASPTGGLQQEERPRSVHAVVAFVTGLFGGPLLLIGLAIRMGVRVSQIRFQYPEDLKAVAVLLITAIAAGLTVLPFRQLKLYWAALLGPVLSALYVLAFGFSYVLLLRLWESLQ